MAEEKCLHTGLCFLTLDFNASAYIVHM